MWSVIRFLFEFLVIFMIGRAIVTGIARFFRSSEVTNQGPAQAPTELPSAGELRKDPVCGTYISVPSPWAKLVKKETVYFCSKDCRDRFRS